MCARIVLLVGALMLPAHVTAMSFLIEEVAASETVPIISPDVGDLRGGAARRYRQKLELQYQRERESSAQSQVQLLEEEVASPEAGVQETAPATKPAEQDQKISEVHEDGDAGASVSSAVPVSSTPTAPAIPTPVERIKTFTQESIEEVDRLTLEQLEEYANEANENADEQIQMLQEGFSVTSTSSLGSPLSVAQRSAILRRTVRTVPQLRLFTRALAESDDNLRKIEIRSDRVVMSYRQNARVLGIVPVSYILETTVEGTDVAINKRWWHVFTRDNLEEYQGELQTQLRILEEGDLDGNDLQNTLLKQQRMLQIMRSISKLLHDTGAV